MELEIAKLILGADDTSFGGLHVTVFDLPFHLALGTNPFGEISSVEKDDGIRRCRDLMTKVFARSNDARLWTGWIMNVPFGSRDEGGIGIAVGGAGRGCQGAKGQNCDKNF